MTLKTWKSNYLSLNWGRNHSPAVPLKSGQAAEKWDSTISKVNHVVECAPVSRYRQGRTGHVEFRLMSSGRTFTVRTWLIMQRWGFIVIFISVLVISGACDWPAKTISLSLPSAVILLWRKQWKSQYIFVTSVTAGFVSRCSRKLPG